MEERQKKRSLLGRIKIIYACLGIVMLMITIVVIYTVNGYNKTISLYSENYYNISRFSNSMIQFSNDMTQYMFYSKEGDSIINAAKEDLNKAESEFKVLYGDRHKLGSQYSEDLNCISDSLRFIGDDFSHIRESIPGMSENLSAMISDVIDRTARIYEGITNEGGEAYNSSKSTMTGFTVIACICLICFILIAIYFMKYSIDRVFKPIKEISEWAKLFDEGYDKMEKLEYNNGDEIQQLSESFNIVRDKLIEGNNLINAYNEAKTKLENEEKNKQQFVKQLYQEKNEKNSISKEAMRDGLTGLLNRRSFDRQVEGYISERRRGALFLIDMDYFKNVNDTLGHINGDEALKMLAESLKIVFAKGLSGRYGGDEFIAFVTDYLNDEDIERKADSLCRMMDKDFEKEGKKVHLSVSVGVASTIGINDYSELYMKADKALYYSKEHGKNKYTLEGDF